jgi:hypothetical protein
MTDGRRVQGDWRNSENLPRRQIREILPRSGLLELVLAADPPDARGVQRFAALLAVGGARCSALRCSAGG